LHFLSDARADLWASPQIGPMAEKMTSAERRPRRQPPREALDLNIDLKGNGRRPNLLDCPAPFEFPDVAVCEVASVCDLLSVCQ